jgi:hypothetical protein
MSSDSIDEKAALINMSQFIFRKEAGKLREGLYDGLIQLGIFLGNQDGVLSFDIQSVIAKHYPNIQLHLSSVESSLVRMVGSGSVFQKRSDKKYLLNPELKRSLSDQISGRKNQIDRLRNIVIEEVKSNLNRDLEQEETATIPERFYLLLSKVLIPRSKVSAALLTGKETEIPEDLGVQEALDKTLVGISDSTLRGAMKRGFSNFFQKLDKETSKFLFDVAENIFLLEVLNLDPECQCLQRIEFSKIFLFLDTNVIMSLLSAHDPRRHNIASEFVEICKSLGINLFVTSQTLTEYNHVLDSSDAAFKSIKIPAHLLEDYIDPFISSFAQEAKLNPSETWEGYYLRMRRLGGDVENRFNVKRYTTDWKEIYQKEFFEEVAEKVSKCAEIHRGGGKKKEVADHDAYHIILVRELRKGQKETIFGPTTWFASLDYSLLCVDRLVDKYYEEKTPATMNCDVWIQMMAPFLSRDLRKYDASEVFSRIISSQFWVARDRVNYENLKVIQGDWLNYSKINEEDLREILATKFVKDYITVANRLIKDNKEVPDDARQKFEKELSIKIDEILNRKIDKFERDMKQRETEIEELRKETQHIKQTSQSKADRTTAFWRQIAGVLGMILAAVNLVHMYSIFIGQNPLTLYSILYLLGSWLVTCVLLMIAIAYDQVRVALKMIWSFSHKSGQ